ncbi:TSUP family transporter [Roseovarius salis]|uniref:sulfite exporter TauE/SafE family protein n=1 Tax=Roseovarius salis TaxID=3376063 RepID=UPI0037C69CDA
MDLLALSGAGPGLVIYAFAVAVLAGLVKGLVGFAMPMVLISGLGSVVSPDLALAWLILPTLVSNGWQALRQGIGAAFESLRKFRVFLLAGLAFLALSSQLVMVLPGPVLLLVIGAPMTLFAAATLAGRPLRLPPRPGPGLEAGIGAVAGFFGGLSGVWGPPTVALLTAMDTEKTEQIRVQGVIYGMGAVALTMAHIASGVLDAATAPVSALLVLPAAIGLRVGFAVQDRIDQRTFRKLTLVVLLCAGLNLVRRGLVGL